MYSAARFDECQSVAEQAVRKDGGPDESVGSQPRTGRKEGLLMYSTRITRRYTSKRVHPRMLMAAPPTRLPSHRAPAASRPLVSTGNRQLLLAFCSHKAIAESVESRLASYAMHRSPLTHCQPVPRTPCRSGLERPRASARVSWCLKAERASACLFPSSLPTGDLT